MCRYANHARSLLSLRGSAGAVAIRFLITDSNGRLCRPQNDRDDVTYHAVGATFRRPQAVKDRPYNARSSVYLRRVTACSDPTPSQTKTSFLPAPPEGELRCHTDIPPITHDMALHTVLTVLPTNLSIDHIP